MRLKWSDLSSADIEKVIRKLRRRLATVDRILGVFEVGGIINLPGRPARESGHGVASPEKRNHGFRMGSHHTTRNTRREL